MIISIKKVIIMMIATILFVAPIGVSATDVYVVANTFHMSGGRNLKYSDIEDIFTLRNKRWSNGTAIRVFLLPRSNPITKDFALKYLNMTANRYYDLLESRESSGKGNISEVVDTEIGLMLRVLTTPGSIGYASDSVIVNFSEKIIIIR